MEIGSSSSPSLCVCVCKCMPVAASQLCSGKVESTFPIVHTTESAKGE